MSDRLSPPVGVRLKILTHAYTRAFNETARDLGAEELSIAYGRIISYLYRNRERDVFQRDLEAQFHITRSSVAATVKQMEKKGYLTRQGVEEDARLKKLTLTPAAQADCQRIMAAMEEVEAQALQGLSQEELTDFLSVCERIQRNLSERKEWEDGQDHCLSDQGV